MEDRSAGTKAPARTRHWGCNLSGDWEERIAQQRDTDTQLYEEPVHDALDAQRTRLTEILRADKILRSVGEIAYEWDLRKDAITWSEHASAVLGTQSVETISSGRQMARLLDPDNMMTPYSAIMSTTQVDQGEGVPYDIEYALLPKGRDSAERIWIEDRGRWFCGSDGRPARAHGLIRIATERHEHDQRLAYLSRFDELTGLYNRTALGGMLGEALKRVAREEGSCAFVIAAIDNLAMINSAYGFDVADNVIREVGGRLQSQLRIGDILGRHSGNKFGMILFDCKDSHMKDAVERLMVAVRNAPVQTEAGPVPVTVSAGGVSLPRFADTVHRAVICAHDALEEAKHRHRDHFVAFQKSMRRESARKRNIMLADEILTALNDGRVEIVFQPVVDATSGEVAFYETLVRLRQLDGSLMPAKDFMSAAEKLSLTELIDHRVLSLAGESLKARPDVRVSVNISAATMDDPVWLDHLRSMIQVTGVKPDQLIIEITETTAIEDVEESNRFVGALRTMGCRVAIDDFGAGYTSFRNLKHLDVDMVKIDGAFVERLREDEDNQFFVRSLIDLARNFQLATVAELVANQEDADLLTSWGIDYLQGYLYGEPEVLLESTIAELQSRHKQYA